MSDVPANRVPFPKPADYDEAKYELLFRNFEAGDLRFPLKPDTHAQRQDRHEQQLRRQHRLHRPELQVPRGELRRAREDHRRTTSRTRRG